MRLSCLILLSYIVFIYAQDLILEKEFVVKFEAEIYSITFTSDHDMLRDAQYVRLSEPEWVPDLTNNSISHTKNEVITLNIELRVLPKNAKYKLVGKAKYNYLSFESEERIATGETENVTIQAKEKLPNNKMMMLQEEIVWNLHSPSGGTFALDESGPHTILVTYNTPLENYSVKEQRITENRMLISLGISQTLGLLEENDPHLFLRELNTLFPEYGILGLHGNAWAAFEYIGHEENLPQCHAIVRFIDCICNTLGIPGERSLFTVYARPESPQIAHLGNMDPYSGYGMLDLPPDPNTGYVGGLYDANNSWNNFEAVIRYDGLYYPGGVGGLAYDSPERVLFGTFVAMKWSYFDEEAYDYLPVEGIEPIFEY